MDCKNCLILLLHNNLQSVHANWINMIQIAKFNLTVIGHHHFLFTVRILIIAKLYIVKTFTMVLTYYTAKLLELTFHTFLCHPYHHCYYYGVDHGISYQKELFLWQTRNLVLSCNRILQQTIRGISRDNDVSKLTNPTKWRAWNNRISYHKT